MDNQGKQTASQDSISAESSGITGIGSAEAQLHDYVDVKMNMEEFEAYCDWRSKLKATQMSSYWPKIEQNEVRGATGGIAMGVPLGTISGTAAKPPRQQLLEQAIKLTCGDRNTSYGEPVDNFANIRQLWDAYFLCKHLGHVPTRMFDLQDVPILNILQKIARLATNPTHRDSAVDIAGYAATLADIQQQMEDFDKAE